MVRIAHPVRITVCRNMQVTSVLTSKTPIKFPNSRFFFKGLYPPEGVCSQTPKGSNWILFPFYWYRKRLSGFQKHERKQAFLKTWKCFIPRRESARRLSRGPIVFTYVLFCVRKWTLKKKKGHPSSVILAEIFPQNVLFDGWVGGWTEYQMGPLIFFILRYIKQYTHLYLNI